MNGQAGIVLVTTKQSHKFTITCRWQTSNETYKYNVPQPQSQPSSMDMGLIQFYYHRTLGQQDIESKVIMQIPASRLYPTLEV